MLLYRNLNMDDLEKLYRNNGTVEPKWFPGSDDSTIPPGNWSFWFAEPMFAFPASASIVTTEAHPALEGIMSYGFHYESMNSREGSKGYDLRAIREFVSDYPVQVSGIWTAEWAKFANQEINTWIACMKTDIQAILPADAGWLVHRTEPCGKFNHGIVELTPASKIAQWAGGLITDFRDYMDNETASASTGGCAIRVTVWRSDGACKDFFISFEAWDDEIYNYMSDD